MSKTISCVDNTIDSNDVFDRIIDLEIEKEDYETQITGLERQYESFKNTFREKESIYINWQATGDLGLDNQEYIRFEYEIAGRDLSQVARELSETTELYEEWLGEEEGGAELERLKQLVVNANLKESKDNILINFYHFENYARELANDLYGIGEGWPFNCIDWDAAADILKFDYRSVEFDGELFYIRS